MADTAVIPQLQRFSECRSCGERIGFVRLTLEDTWRPVDPEPRPLAEYALLRDGVSAVNLRHPLVDLDLADRHDGPCYWDHRKTCRVAGMVTTRAVLQAEGGYRNDPERERKRARLLAAGRSPWVKRPPGG